MTVIFKEALPLSRKFNISPVPFLYSSLTKCYISCPDIKPLLLYLPLPPPSLYMSFTSTKLSMDKLSLQLLCLWVPELMGVSPDGGMGSPRWGGGVQILPYLSLSYLIPDIYWKYLTTWYYCLADR